MSTTTSPIETNETDDCAADGILSPAELGAWRGLLRTHAEITRELDADLQRAHGLTLSQYEVLLVLQNAEEGRVRMSELAESVLLSRSGLTRLVDRLVAEELVERLRCASDARSYYAVITDRGRETFDAARRTHLEGVRDRFLSRFSEAELRSLGDLWQRVSLTGGSRPRTAAAPGRS